MMKKKPMHVHVHTNKKSKQMPGGKKNCHEETVLNLCYFRRRFVQDYYNAER